MCPELSDLKYDELYEAEVWTSFPVKGQVLIVLDGLLGQLLMHEAEAEVYETGDQLIVRLQEVLDDTAEFRIIKHVS